MRGLTFLLIWSLLAAGMPAHAAEGCLSDDEIRTIVRSVYTRSIGRVLHTCGDAYPKLDPLALRAANDFFTAYAEDMRENRTNANAIMMRFAGDAWQQELDALLAETTAGDEMWAHLATEQDCQQEIIKVGRAATDRDYAAAMTNPRTTEQFATERARVPACEAATPGASDAKE